MLNLIHNSNKKKTNDSLEIAQSGLEAIIPEKILLKKISIVGNELIIKDKRFDLPKNNLYIIGGGKASLSMAKSLEKIFKKKQKIAGVINSPIRGSLEKIKVFEADHPIPNEKGVSGVKAMLELTKSLSSADMVICLISSGGSALLPHPVEGVSLNDMQVATKVLIKKGVEVFEIQKIRKHISKIKGGQLAKHLFPAQIITIILSDLVNPNDVVASGPTEPDSSTYQDALNVIQKYKLKNKIPNSIINHLRSGAKGKISETPNSVDESFKRVNNIVLANYNTSLLAMADKARELGYQPIIRKTPLLGDLKKETILISKEIKTLNKKYKQAFAYIYNSELTVSVHGNGEGGRCQEHMARLAGLLYDMTNYSALSIGSDGIDHTPNAAGAVIDQDTINLWREKGIRSQEYINNHDTYHLHLKSKTIIKGYKTGTSVGDLHLCLFPERK